MISSSPANRNADAASNKEPHKMTSSTSLRVTSTHKHPRLPSVMMVPSPTHHGNRASSFNTSVPTTKHNAGAFSYYPIPPPLLEKEDRFLANELNKTRRITYDFSHPGMPPLPFSHFDVHVTRGSGCRDIKIDDTRLTLAMRASQNSRLQICCATAQKITRKRTVSETSCDDITPLEFASPVHIEFTADDAAMLMKALSDDDLDQFDLGIE